MGAGDRCHRHRPCDPRRGPCHRIRRAGAGDRLRRQRPDHRGPAACADRRRQRDRGAGRGQCRAFGRTGRGEPGPDPVRTRRRRGEHRRDRRCAGGKRPRAGGAVADRARPQEADRALCRHDRHPADRDRPVCRARHDLCHAAGPVEHAGGLLGPRTADRCACPRRPRHRDDRGRQFLGHRPDHRHRAAGGCQFPHDPCPGRGREPLRRSLPRPVPARAHRAAEGGRRDRRAAKRAQLHPLRRFDLCGEAG